MIVTNHAALNALKTQKNLGSNILSYAKQLLLYKYKIFFLPRSKNRLANMLSRAIWVKEVLETKFS